MGVGGSLLVSASMVVLSGVDLDTGYAYIIFAMVLSGMGLGASSPSMAATIANTVDEADFGVAGATQQLAAQVGIGRGHSDHADGAGVARVDGRGLIGSYSDAYLVGAVSPRVGAVCALFIRGGKFTPRLTRRARLVRVRASCPVRCYLAMT